jgi:MFS transporter, OFA family, oxalate/formate antiporter
VASVAQTVLEEPMPESPGPQTLLDRVRGLYWGWWIVGVAFTAQFVSVGAQNYVVGAFLKPMTTEFEWTRSEFLLSRTLGQFVMAFTGFFIGGYVDRNGGRRLMQIGIVVLALSMFATSFVNNLWQWWLLNGLMITAGAAMVGNLVVNVTLSKWFVEKRGRVSSTAAMGVSFAGVLLTPLAALLVADFGWRVAWRILAVGGFAIIAPLTLIMRRAPEDHGLHPDGRSATEVAAGAGRAAMADFDTSLTRQQAVRTRAFYFIVFGFGLGALSIGVMLLQTIPFMTDAGYSSKTGALMITLTSIPSLLSKPVWGWLVDRVDAKSAVLGFLLNAFSLVIIVFAVRSHTDWAVYTGFFLLGLGWGGLIPLQEVVWASFFGRRYLGAVRSAGLPFALIIQASSPVLTSYYFDRVGNYDGAFFTVAALALVATALLLMAQKPESRRGLSVRG